MTSRRVRVWDLPTRLFHWVLVICVVLLVITGNIGGDAMAWHFRLGLMVLTLVVFRVLWGFVGGYWSRFAQWFPTPGRTLGYLRGTVKAPLGHNPLGAWSVLALLVLLALQVSSGLMSDDEIAFAGPLTRFVSGDWVALATKYHKHIGKLVLMLLIVLHVAAVVYYKLAKRDDLIRPMIHGDKTTDEPTTESRDTLSTRLLALAMLAVGVALAGYVWSLST